MKIVLSLVVLVLLSSCGMTNENWDAFNRDMQPTYQSLHNMNRDIDYPTYSTPQVQPYTRLNNNQNTNYMINTSDGIKMKNCIRLPSGSMYCH